MLPLRANVTRIERQYGLPGLNSDESAEELKSTMLSRPELAGHPMLHKALRGSAGAYLCEAALNSVSNPDLTVSIRAAPVWTRRPEEVLAVILSKKNRLTAIALGFTLSATDNVSTDIVSG